MTTEGRAMPRKHTEKLPRGIFERPSGSRVYWILYYKNGERHREKAGTLSTAISLYRDRKADILKGRKLPELRNKKFITIAALIDDALEHVQHHKDLRNYQSKAAIVKAGIGGRKADELKPSEIAAWLNKQCKTGATMNRYRAFLSLVYRVGQQNEKIDVNPARSVPHRKEHGGRLRFLSREEYDRLLAVIRTRASEHAPSFIASVNSGMRLSEQFTAEWSQYHPERRAIELSRTKNGDSRTVHLNKDAIDAIESLRVPGRKMKGRIFPHSGGDKWLSCRDWFPECAKEAGIENYVWHSNRHTFCSWLAMAGASTVEIQKAAGHRAIAMAVRYSHLSPEHQLSVVDRIAGTPSGNEQPPKQPPHK
jgi:site-specific recombinase XerD